MAIASDHPLLLCHVAKGSTESHSGKVLRDGPPTLGLCLSVTERHKQMGCRTEWRQLCGGCKCWEAGQLFELKYHQVLSWVGSWEKGRERCNVVPVTLRLPSQWIQLLQALGTSDSHFTFYIFLIMKWKAPLEYCQKWSSPDGNILDLLAPLRKELLYEISAATLEILSLCFCFAFFPLFASSPSTSSSCVTYACVWGGQVHLCS